MAAKTRRLRIGDRVRVLGWRGRMNLAAAYRSLDVAQQNADIIRRRAT